MPDESNNSLEKLHAVVENAATPYKRAEALLLLAREQYWVNDWSGQEASAREVITLLDGLGEKPLGSSAGHGFRKRHLADESVGVLRSDALFELARSLREAGRLE